MMMTNLVDFERHLFAAAAPGGVRQFFSRYQNSNLTPAGKSKMAGEREGQREAKERKAWARERREREALAALEWERARRKRASEQREKKDQARLEEHCLLQRRVIQV